MQKQKIDKLQRIRERADLYRSSDEAFARWAAGYGLIEHTDLTQVRIKKMADMLVLQGKVSEPDKVYDYLYAADRIASACLWLVAHMTYAQNVYLDGRDLVAEDFKAKPEGHSGGSLNMAIAYTGYFAANAILSETAGWIMGQGHCVAAIDAANLIMDNQTAQHGERYDLSDPGLTRFVRDFYSLKINPDRSHASPIGSHVNAHTAGGIIEGGYLGFAELYYIHMPLPGETLVAFLSDGAFEEQKGGDWAPRWWRAEDSGLVAPIMIANGRRIDQRTTVSMQGGVDWFRDHLELNGFEPIDIDGRDPAAYAWAIWEMKERLSAHGQAVKQNQAKYPVPLPYAIAEVPKGFGFTNAGKNIAHNLPLGADLVDEPDARGEFNAAARKIWVPPEELFLAVEKLKNHKENNRPLERDNSLGNRSVIWPKIPEPSWFARGETVSPMGAFDEYFCCIIDRNPDLRPRIGNPDEMTSNRMAKTLWQLNHRVTDPEPSTPESVHGKVITALNEEAVVCSALANKGGINLVVTYEAFAVKMLGAIRQELNFTRHLKEAGRTADWLSIPIVSTSHTWENGKNELSHQDPTCCEALMNEMSDFSKVFFAADANSALAVLRHVYSKKSQIWNLIIPKRAVPNWFDVDEAEKLLDQSAVCMRQMPDAELIITAIGSYQLIEAVKASDRLKQKQIAHKLIYMAQPTSFRNPRDKGEASSAVSDEVRNELYPQDVTKRIFVTHTRPEPIAGVLRPLDTGSSSTEFIGFINQGGTYDVFAMLFANRCTWGHIVYKAAKLLGRQPSDLLESAELGAVLERSDPYVLKD